MMALEGGCATLAGRESGAGAMPGFGIPGVFGSPERGFAYRIGLAAGERVWCDRCVRGCRGVPGFPGDAFRLYVNSFCREVTFR